ncbi:GyrI-like domain-containing protein [Motiliproteus sp. MSK22-1]|uniref:AraC family transcriptional regulator n=1 Tax=Motiliproteus sp. MSK22-1 TaxID=1897630 RepID=UPI00097668A9|nr:AraC family transcriptional regulator [Motiliproteus sp. MSK22-1]OMH36193.1 hypothetical protein BGP75_10150 [Motiliproteus sp. MSK22-1]
MKQKTAHFYKQKMLKVLNYIQENLDEPLQLNTLAEVACFSPYHFHRLFKGMTGESLQQHIRRLRMERAAWRLRLGDQSIIRIAHDAGYASDVAFSRAFKSLCGLSPAVFRANQRAPFPLLSPIAIRYSETERLKEVEFFHSKEMSMKVVIKEMPEVKVAYVRHVGPYAECGKAWEKLFCFLGPQGVLGGQAKILGLSHDDPEVTPAQEIRYDACVTLEDGIELKEEGRKEAGVGVKMVDGGEYAVTTHFGPYDTLAVTYAKFFGEWLSSSDRSPADRPCFEIYLNDPESTAPEDLVTDIYMPLEEVKQ